MSKKQKIKLLLIYTVFVSTIFVGCSNNSNSFKVESPSTDNTLVWHLTTFDVSSWDPHTSSSGVVGDISRQIFEGLTVLGEDGHELGIAESYTVLPNDEGIENTVYTFKIRQDAKWSDGKDVTAQDFEYSFRRACSQKDNDVTKIFELYIKGADEYINGAGSKDNIGVTAIDKNTLKIELKQPVPFFMEILSMHQFLPVRKDVVEKIGAGWETSPNTCISNGPFKLDSYVPGSKIMLAKNNNYYDIENVKLQYVNCIINTQNKNGYQMFDNNEIHILQISPYGDIDGEDWLFADYTGTSYIKLNAAKKPFDDIDVRKAFSYGIDRKYFCEKVYYGVIPASGIVPPGIKNYGTIENKSVNNDYLNEFNSDKAKQLLNEAGYDNNFPEIEFTVHNEFVGDNLKSMLEYNLGIKIKLNVVSFEEYLEKSNTGDYDMIFSSWSADYFDPMTFLSNFSFSSNNSLWHNQYFEKAIANSLTKLEEERNKYLIDAEKVLNDELPIIPLYHYRVSYRFNNELLNDLKCDALGRLVIKNCSINIENIEVKEREDGEDNNIYGFDNRNRIEEIDSNGYFEDSAENRFDKYKLSEHFEIYYNSTNDVNGIYASNSLNILEENYDRILNFLNVNEENMPVVKIIMYDNYEQLRQSLIKEISFDGESIGSLQGYTVNNNKFYYTLKDKYSKTVDLKKVLLHEFTHTVTMALAGENNHEDWLLDGIAMYLAQDKDFYEPYYKEFLEQGIPELYTLKRNDRDRYVYGYSMVEFIIEVYGREKLVELLCEYGDIEKVLKISEREFREEWMKFLCAKIS